MSVMSLVTIVKYLKISRKKHWNKGIYFREWIK